MVAEGAAVVAVAAAGAAVAVVEGGAPRVTPLPACTKGCTERSVSGLATSSTPRAGVFSLLGLLIEEQ